PVGGEIEIGGLETLRQAASAELSFLLERKSPENIRTRNDGRAHGIDRCNGAHGDGSVDHGRRAADSPLVRARDRAITSPGIAERDEVGRRSGSLAPQWRKNLGVEASAAREI